MNGIGLPSPKAISKTGRLNILNFWGKYHLKLGHLTMFTLNHWSTFRFSFASHFRSCTFSFFSTILQLICFFLYCRYCAHVPVVYFYCFCFHVGFIFCVLNAVAQICSFMFLWCLEQFLIYYIFNGWCIFHWIKSYNSLVCFHSSGVRCLNISFFQPIFIRKGKEKMLYNLSITSLLF